MTNFLAIVADLAATAPGDLALACVLTAAAIPSAIYTAYLAASGKLIQKEQ